jgi:DnaJ-class molecular chaperone
MRGSKFATGKPSPTMPCPACAGTGLNRARACEYAASRTIVGSDPTSTVATVACSACEGRGRQTIARVMFERST